MTTSHVEFSESYWCSGEMTTTTAIQHLLTRDLEARSSGSSGRELVRLLEDYRLGLLGTTNSLDFARRLQADDPDARRKSEELLEWTGQVPDFRLVALVALAPRLDAIAQRLGRGRPSADTIAEVLTQATDALRWSEELVEGERVDFVLTHTLSRTRGEQRRLGRHNVPADPLPPEFDLEEVGKEEFDLSSLMSRAVRLRVISPRERRLIETTRTGEHSLSTLAQLSAERYDAIRARRARAERRLRRFYDVGQ
jgi:hypothetical protein